MKSSIQGVILQDEVEKYIKHEGLLKKKFAEKIGISPQMLSYWLSGKYRLSSKNLDRICEIIGIE